MPENDTMIPVKPLGLIKTLIETVGLDVTYVYDDLVFIEHNAFLFQMGEQGEDIGLWFNVDCKVEERPKILLSLHEAAAGLSLTVDLKGTYSMNTGAEDESFQLAFNPTQTD